MQTIRLRLDYLYGFRDDADLPQDYVAVDAIKHLLKQHLPFFPDPTNVELHGDEVIRQYALICEKRMSGTQ